MIAIFEDKKDSSFKFYRSFTQQQAGNMPMYVPESFKHYLSKECEVPQQLMGHTWKTQNLVYWQGLNVIFSIFPPAHQQIFDIEDTVGGCRDWEYYQRLKYFWILMTTDTPHGVSGDESYQCLKIFTYY